MHIDLQLSRKNKEIKGRVYPFYHVRGSDLPLEIVPSQKFSKIIRTKIEEEAASLGRFLEASWEVKFKEL
jgi:hypothetical protein